MWMKGNSKLDYNNPNHYIGTHLECRKGYALPASARENSASGGLVTALLCNMLTHGDIGGAWVTKTAFVNGELTYQTYIATTVNEICDAASSVYITVPMLKHLDILEDYKGEKKIAVVMIPCMMYALERVLKQKPHLKEKIALKVGLYCSGTVHSRCLHLGMKKAGVATAQASRFYFRRGHWRGRSGIVYEDGSQKTFSYSKYVCTYKNAYFFAKSSCLHCQDQFALYSDISFGDVWLKEMKQHEIKHTSCVIRTKDAARFMDQAVSDGVMLLDGISGADIVRSQKRALVFKFNCLDPKRRRKKWNYRLAYYLAKKNQNGSARQYRFLEKMPTAVLYYYMCFIRVLLNF
jgi:coenzyme F420 hydrogenase subunit beta